MSSRSLQAGSPNSEIFFRILKRFRPRPKIGPPGGIYSSGRSSRLFVMRRRQIVGELGEPIQGWAKGEP